MEEKVFDEINMRLVDIMNFIESQKGFPLLMCDVHDYLKGDANRSKLCEIYLIVSQLRSLCE